MAPTKSLNNTLTSNSNDNILDFYKLQPLKTSATKSLHEEEDSDEMAVDYSNIILPVDLNTLPHGEQFKPQESTTFDDTYVKSKSSTKGSLSLSSPHLLDETDSYLTINDSVSYDRDTTFNNANAKDLINQSSSEETYFKPIETMTAEDFFNVAKPPAETKSIDLIKAKFEASKDTSESDSRKKFKPKSEDKSEDKDTSDTLSAGKFARIKKSLDGGAADEKDKKKGASTSSKQLLSEDTLDMSSASSSVNTR